jgi:hypothetical protein
LSQLHQRIPDLQYYPTFCAIGKTGLATLQKVYSTLSTRNKTAYIGIANSGA